MTFVVGNCRLSYKFKIDAIPMAVDEISINNEMVTFPGMDAIAGIQFTATCAFYIIVGNKTIRCVLTINAKKFSLSRLFRIPT